MGIFLMVGDFAHGSLVVHIKIYVKWVLIQRNVDMIVASFHNYSPDDQPSNKEKRLACIRTLQAQEFKTEHSVI